MAYTKLDRVRPSPAGVWDSTRPYTALELVNSPDGWKAYLARKAVPAGTALTDTTYWTEVLDVSDVIAAAQSATADANAAAAFAEPIRTKADGIKCTIEGASVAATDASDDYLRGLRVFGKTTQDGTPSPENPVELVSVGGGGNIGVKVCGKNFANLTYRAQIPSITTGLDVGAPGWASDHICIGGNIVTLSRDDQTAAAEMYILLYDKDKKYIGYTGTAVAGMSLCSNGVSGYKNARYCRVRLTDGSGSRVRLQLEIGNVATKYEPYAEQPLTLTTPNGLPGIPVSSGGNCTDADGQMWISDEIDLERGVYAQRIGHITSYASENISGAWMSSTGALSTGASVLYQLATPIETALSATEIAAYRALHSNYPNTTVYNDAGAHMAVSYNADTKTYIDNKFAALSAAIV